MRIVDEDIVRGMQQGSNIMQNSEVLRHVDDGNALLCLAFRELTSSVALLPCCARTYCRALTNDARPRTRNSPHPIRSQSRPCECETNCLSTSCTTGILLNGSCRASYAWPQDQRLKCSVECVVELSEFLCIQDPLAWFGTAGAKPTRQCHRQPIGQSSLFQVNAVSPG